MANVPNSSHTPINLIPKIASDLRSTFATHKTKPLHYRLTQLRKLYWSLKDNENAVNEACKRDLGKSSIETLDGCTVAIKPSESAPNAAAVVQNILESVLDQSAYRVIQGAVPETTALLEEKWDKIIYTRGSAVARIISKKAAETLTPLTLELGGRNPAIVSKNADIHLAAKRLLWGKTVNAGQVCVSQNYTLIDESVVPEFISELKSAMHLP